MGGLLGRARRAARRRSGPRSSSGLSFDDEGFEARLLWIWGTPRSGSSWLLQLLAHPLHPDPERVAGFRGLKRPHRPHDAIPIDEPFIANHLAPAFAEPREVDGIYVPGTLNNYLAGKPSYALSSEYEDVWRPEARRFALVRLHGVIDRARREGFEVEDLPTVAIKEVNGSHASDLVMGLMPRARMLLLARDGRDVVDSLLHAYRPGGFLARNQGRVIETPAERAEGVRWAAGMWRCNADMTMRAIERHPSGLSRILRYEDLRADAVPHLSSLFEWLGLSRSAARIEEIVAAHTFESVPESKRGPLTRNRSARPGLWRENLSVEEQRTANEIMGPALERLGYEL